MLSIISLPKLLSPTDSCHVLVFLLEVVADDTPAVQAVLKADTRRLRLLEEEKRLQARLEKGEDSVADRLEKVCVCVCACALFESAHHILIFYFSLILILSLLLWFPHIEVTWWAKK